MTDTQIAVNQLNHELFLKNSPFEAVAEDFGNEVMPHVSVWNTATGDFFGSFDDASEASFALKV